MEKDMRVIRIVMEKGDHDLEAAICRYPPAGDAVMKKEHMVTWLGQVFLGLEHLHHLRDLNGPIIHGDVKPQHVVICRPYRTAKLIDCGKYAIDVDCLSQAEFVRQTEGREWLAAGMIP